MITLKKMLKVSTVCLYALGLASCGQDGRRDASQVQPGQQRATTVFVSPDGSGEACSQSRPCDLQAARVRSRALLLEDPARNIEVLLAGGTYSLQSPFILGPEDSGTAGHLIIWKNKPGETPVFSAGREAGNWTLADADKNIWVSALPAGTDFRTLYVNGKTARRAWTDYDTAGITIQGNRAFAWKYDFSKWQHPEDLEVVRRDMWRHQQCPVDKAAAYVLDMSPACVAKFRINREGTAVHELFLTAIEAGEKGPALENAYELLDAPGEWYFDKHTSKLFYMPREGESLDGAAGSIAKVVYPEATSLFQLRGYEERRIENIRIEGITFRYTDAVIGQTINTSPASPEKYPPGTMNISFAKNVAIVSNYFLDTGRDALHFDGGGDDILISGNGFGETGGIAISLLQSDVDQCCGWSGGTTERNRKRYISNVEISNNYITNTGKIVNGDGAGGAISYGELTRDIRIVHNELRNAATNGIASSWFNLGWYGVLGKVEIASNKIIDWCSNPNTGDEGAIVISSSNTAKSTIHDNYIEGPRCAGMYADVFSDGIEMFRNVVKGASSSPYEAGWLLIVSSKNTDVHDNWSDNTVWNNVHNNVKEVWEFGFYSSAIPVSIGNVQPNNVHDNTTIENDNWPLEAHRVMAEAGLLPAFSHLRTRVNAEIGET